MGDGEGDGFVGGVGLGRKVDGGVAGERLGAGDVGDFVGAEGVGGLGGLAFLPGAEEELAGARVGAEAVRVDEALGGIVLDEEGRAGADERREGLGSGVNRLGLRGRWLGVGDGRGVGRGLATAEEQEQATDYQTSEHRAEIHSRQTCNRLRR